MKIQQLTLLIGA